MTNESGWDFPWLQEEEYQSIRWLATTNTTSREQKAYL